jgi:beta-phosphoglucomutase-like phosphatase (HAD superfamily)
LYFFWSEHDRTAGYRKMQILGALLSSIDSAVNEIVEDEEAFRQAWLVMLEQHAEQLAGAEEEGISESTMTRLDIARELFDKSREAYAECYPELHAIDHSSNRGEILDPEKAVAEVVAAINAIAEAKRAKICVAVALAHLKCQPGIDPADRFFNRAHVAAVRELDEPARAYHRHLMNALHQRLADAQQP